MNYLSAENISRNLGERELFNNLSFGLSRGDKTALVASNGAGKSTLLKMLVGKEEPDTGRVSVRNGIRVGFLEQEPELDGNLTILDLLGGANSDVLEAIRKYEHAVEMQAVDFSETNIALFEEASARMDTLQAWDYERRMKHILTRFGLTKFEQPIHTFSGGQKKRLALAMVLLDEPDLLILDEPTNHLDVDMIEWLEDYLLRSTLTLLMVTHDRYFLDRVCNNIFELTNGKLYTHAGNYSYFLEKRAEREETMNTELDKDRKLLRKELEWIRRMPKARTTKSKSRVDAFYDLKEKTGGKKPEQELKLQVKMSRIGGMVLELKKVRKSFGEHNLLDGFDYTFKRGERIGIVGRNGSGKTTFLDIITGKAEPDSGKVNLGDTIVYGYYAQTGIQIKEDKRVIDVVKDIADYIEMGDGSKLLASQFLQHFLFPPNMHHTPVSKLSGGERRRLYLLTVLIKNPNFLVLDEPTNDLDLLTLNRLEEFLSSFKGCLVIVSHDRYFMDKLVDHLFIFEGNGIVRDFNGTYSEYRMAKDADERQEQQLARQKTEPIQVQEVAAPVKKKPSFKEKFEHEQLEKEIAMLESEKVMLEQAISDTSLHHTELTEKLHRLQEVISLIDTKTLRWLELDEFFG